MAKRKRKEIPELKGNWLTTYGDMVTLLLTFFVFLYSFSSIDVQKFQKMIYSFQSAIGVLSGGVIGVPEEEVSVGEQPVTPSKDVYFNAMKAQKIHEMIVKMLEAEELTEGVVVRVEERGIVISIMDGILFPTGSIDLYPSAKRLIYKIGQIIKELPSQISVEGHTDNVPLRGGPYRDNLGLSAMRAASVGSYLSEVGVDTKRIRTVGYGSSRPLVPNDTDEHRRINRRVDIVILSDVGY